MALAKSPAGRWFHYRVHRRKGKLSPEKLEAMGREVDTAFEQMMQRAEGQKRMDLEELEESGCSWAIVRILGKGRMQRVILVDPCESEDEATAKFERDFLFEGESSGQVDVKGDETIIFKDAAGVWCHYTSRKPVAEGK